MPTFWSLTMFKKQLKVSAQSVSCNLGGGAHGHIGLFLPPNDTVYKIPPIPGTLTILCGTVSVEAVRRRDVHLERIYQFREVHDIKKC